jgi:hypothetical protein
MTVATADTGGRHRSQQVERCAYARSSDLRQESSSTAITSATANGSLVGTSAAHKQLMEKLDKVAPTDAEVLISGPTGVGKELCASYIHQQSGRAKASFVPVNCGGLPIELIENELFGHVGGAFTGARPQRPKAAPCFLTRSTHCRSPVRRSCCDSSKTRIIAVSARRACGMPTCGSSLRPMPTSSPPSAPRAFAMICSSGCGWCRWKCPRSPSAQTTSSCSSPHSSNAARKPTSCLRS